MKTMYYLVGESVYTFNSGVEFSQFKRLEAFNEKGYDTRLLTRNYDRFLARDTIKHHVDPKYVINMYDYFQGTILTDRKEQKLRCLSTIPLDYYHVVGVDNNHSHVLLDGKIIEDIDVMPETIGLIDDTKYKDSIGNLSIREYWDWRGFLSMTETYHPSGEVSHQQYFNMQGVPVIEVAFMNLNGKVQPTMWKLLSYKNKDYHFDNENQLFSFFLNEINSQQPGTFISDRRSVDESVLNIKNAEGKFGYVHSVPFENPKHPAKSALLSDYNYVFNPTPASQKIFDKVIVPTEDLMQDMRNRFPEYIRRFVSAPDSWYSVMSQVRNLPQKKQLIYVGRLAEDKNIEDIIETFNILLDKRNDTSLLLQGYFSSVSYNNKIRELIKKNDLMNYIVVKPYAPITQDDYKSATLFINTSKSEGFGMNMLESMSYGVPVASYSNIYSKNNLIRHGVNGISVKNKSASVLANQIDSLLSNSDEYNKLSQGALHTAKKFSESNFLKAWMKLL